MSAPVRSSVVFETLRTEILTGLLTPGAPINEKVIAKRLGVSQTPVREAIMDLVGQGYVDSDDNRRRHVAAYPPGRAAEVVELQGLLYQLALRRVADLGTEPELDELADRFDAAAEALTSGDGPAVDRTTGELVGCCCRIAGQSAVSTALPRVSQRGFALVLLPDGAWDLWRGWGTTMARLGQQVRSGAVRRAADDYLAAELALATRIRRLWPAQNDVLAHGGSLTDRDPVDGAAPGPNRFGHPGRFEPSGPTRADAVAEQIRSDILYGRLQPGDPLPEVGLARRYGVSTTPVREALRLLNADGLIELGSGRRRRVSSRTDAELRDLLGLLRHLMGWLLTTAMPLMSELDFDACRQIAAELSRLATRRRSDYVTGWLSLWERIGDCAGNQQVQALARTTLTAILPYLTGIRIHQEAIALLREFASIPYADRVDLVPRWFAALSDRWLADLGDGSTDVSAQLVDG